MEENELSLEKVLGAKNPAYMLTKSVSCNERMVD